MKCVEKSVHRLWRIRISFGIPTVEYPGLDIVYFYISTLIQPLKELYNDFVTSLISTLKTLKQFDRCAVYTIYIYIMQVSTKYK